MSPIPLHRPFTRLIFAPFCRRFDLMSRQSFSHFDRSTTYGMFLRDDSIDGIVVGKGDKRRIFRLLNVDLVDRAKCLEVGSNLLLTQVTNRTHVTFGGGDRGGGIT